MEKTFSVEQSGKTDYRLQILSIINDIERKARSVEPNSVLSKELHEKKQIDARNEVLEFERVRADVCETFGITKDDDHVFLFGTGPDKVVSEQRALRAFFVMIDTLRKEGYYGEGRIDHNTLFRQLVKMSNKNNSTDMSFEEVVEKIDTDPPGFLIFKGFLSIKDFREISEASRKVLETPLIDGEGNPIHTAEDWFITGHNLSEVQAGEHEEG